MTKCNLVRDPTCNSRMPSPDFRDVTSRNPADPWKPRRLFAELAWTFNFAAVGAALCGLPFHLVTFLTASPYSSVYLRAGIPSPAVTPGAGWYAVAVAVRVRLVTLMPSSATATYPSS